MKEYSDYIILDIGKIFIKRDNNKNEYYKELNDELIELTEEELQKINNIFNNDKSNEYYHEIDFKKLIEQNNNIAPKDSDYITNFFAFLDRIIPENCKDNFYRNIKTVKLKLNLDSDFSNIDTSTINENSLTLAGSYNAKENNLTIPPESLKMLLDIARKTENPTAFFWKYLNLDILHEFSHMASAYYNEETQTTLCGFNRYPAQEPDDENRGLTEGMTEVIAMTGVPDTIEISSGYYIEAAFVNQLMLIIGPEVLLSSYFGNKGIKELEICLNNIIDDPKKSNVLFRRIEDNYYLKNSNHKQTILANIQSTLIDYFKEKIIKDIENGVDIEELKPSIYRFEYMLITKDKLTAMKKTPENYIGLAESILKFAVLKEQILSSTDIKGRNTK